MVELRVGAAKGGDIEKNDSKGVEQEGGAKGGS